MLLRASGADIQPFAVEGLFLDANVFKGLLQSEEPSVLTMKPKELYEKIRKVALHRYSLELPENQQDLLCLKKANTKLAVLRDICLKVGVKLLAGGKDFSREYNLDNEVSG